VALRRRLLLELEIPDLPGGIMLTVLEKLTEFLEGLKKADLLVDYGVQLETANVWIVTLRTEEDED